MHDLVDWGGMCDESASGEVKHGLHYLHVSDTPFHDITSSLTPSHAVGILVTDVGFDRSLHFGR